MTRRIWRRHQRDANEGPETPLGFPKTLGFRTGGYYFSSRILYHSLGNHTNYSSTRVYFIPGLALNTMGKRRKKCWGWSRLILASKCIKKKKKMIFDLKFDQWLDKILREFFPAKSIDHDPTIPRHISFHGGRICWRPIYDQLPWLKTPGTLW